MKNIIFLSFLLNVASLFAINVAIPSWPSHLNAPSELVDSVSFNVAHYIHAPLLVLDGKKNFSSNIFKKWTKDPLNKEYCFSLKDSIYFHNNSKVTVDDVIYSINKCLNKNSCSLYHSLKNIELKKVSENQFCILLKEPSAIFLFSLSDKKLSIIPKKDNGGIVGAGPYRFSKKEGNKIFLERFEQYSGPKPLNESIVFHVYEAKEKFLKDIETIKFQEINQMTSILSSVDMIKIEKYFPKKIYYPFFNTNVIFLNNDKDIFKDIYVRKFFYCVFRANNLYKIVSDPFSAKASGFIPEGMMGHLKNYPSCKDSDMKAYYSKFTHHVFVQLATSFDKEKRDIVQNKINEILKDFKKVKVDVLSSSKQNFYRVARERKYDMIFITWIAEFTHPFFYLSSLHSENDHNFGNIKDKKIDQIFSSYTKKKKNRFKDFDRYIMNQAYLIPLSYNQGIYYYKKDVTNINLSVLGPDAFDLSNFQEK